MHRVIPWGDCRLKAPPRVVLLAGLAGLIVAVLPALVQAQRQGVEAGGDTLDLLDDLNKDGGNWWNDAWPLRRQIILEGPGLDALDQGVAFFSEPDPLLLCNTGRCLPDGADLRILTRDGRMLPCGVVHFGRDDGACQLWCIVPDDELAEASELAGRRVSLYLYYGNRQAEAQDANLPERVVPPRNSEIVAWAAPEETAPGAEPPATPAIGSFHGSVIAIEAEQFQSPPPGPSSSPHVLVQPMPEASAAAVLVPRGPVAADKPATVAAAAAISEPGAWRVHVRFQTGDGTSAFKPFKLRVGGNQFDCGGDNPATETGFRWQSFVARIGAPDLAEGVVKLAIEFTGPSAPDCVLLTRDARYLPDYRDVTGPLWMRFKLLDDARDAPAAEVSAPLSAALEPFYVHWYCIHTPYSERGMLGDTACYLFRNRMARVKANARPLLADAANLIAPGEWSDWGLSLHSTAYTWFSQINFLSHGDIGSRPLSNVRAAYQVATRPDPARVYHEGVDVVGPGGLRIRMPTGLDQASLSQVEGFGEWAGRRFKLVEDLGFSANEGPTRIMTATMGHFFETPTEIDQYLKTSNYLGLNTACVHHQDQEMFARLCEQYRIDHGLSHPFVYGISFDGLTGPRAGRTFAQTAEEIVEDQAAAFYKSTQADKSWVWKHARWGIVGDEIGPAVSSLEINGHPFFKGLFIEYLEAQGLKPEFFGAQRWDEIRAIDYIVESDSRLQDALARQRRIEETNRAVEEAAGRDFAVDGPASGDDLGADVLESIAGEGQSVAPPATLEPRFEKRIYHWTQKFRSDYTCRFYRQVTAALHRYTPDDYRVTVNLQAAPAQAGVMWDGALNIFDLGRRRAFDALYTEDWHGGTCNVAFAMGLLRAASRRHQQELGSYVVGGMPQGRVLANLSQGTRLLVFYLYGPVHNIGPVWGEDSATMRDIGRGLRLAGRTEDDLLASRNRPADAALLVANTSEINGRHFAYDFGRDRIALLTAMCDAQLPLDIIGEEEVVEDDILKNYRALFVCDPHVNSRAQEIIKQWVADGGTLWSTYAGLARQEYDEPSDRFDEVFGLSSRGPIEPAPAAGQGANAATITVPRGGLLPAIEFEASYCQPRYQLSTGQALAHFADRLPAIVHNRHGRGQAFLNAFQTRVFLARDARLLPLVAAPAHAAKVRPHVRANQPELFTVVHDGPRQTVVFLFNDSATRPVALPLEVLLPKPARDAVSGRGGRVEWTMKGNSAVVQIALPAREGEILVFLY
jgi:hypothetical protein